jgi:hypothetical protein
LCYGADPNRNSNVHWNESNVSTNPCSGFYPGEYAFSEPEIRQLSEFMWTIPNLQIYLSFHTFGQFFMIPRGFTEEPIDNYDLHYRVGEVANAAITEATGAEYQLGPVTQFFGMKIIKTYFINLNAFLTFQKVSHRVPLLTGFLKISSQPYLTVGS